MVITSNLLPFRRFPVSFRVHRLVCHPLSEQMEIKDKRWLAKFNHACWLIDHTLKLLTNLLNSFVLVPSGSTFAGRLSELLTWKSYCANSILYSRSGKPVVHACAQPFTLANRLCSIQQYSYSCSVVVRYGENDLSAGKAKLEPLGLGVAGSTTHAILGGEGGWGLGHSPLRCSADRLS